MKFTLPILLLLGMPIGIASADPDRALQLTMSESFNYRNGTTESNEAMGWTAERSRGTFEVSKKSLTVNEAGPEAVFSTSTMNITDTSLDVALKLKSKGNLENDQDYVRFYMVVDGGSEVLIGERTGNQPTATTISKEGITGSSLKLVVRTSVSAGNEHYYLQSLTM